MLFYTHIVFGLLLGIVYLKIFSNILSIQNDILFLIFVILGSILPDIDNPKSMIGRKIPFISSVIKFILGHRGIFHSLWFLLLISLFFYFVVNKIIAIGIFVGYFSHLFLDAFTIRGLRFFYPLSYSIRGNIKTGSLFEKIFLIVMIIVVLIIISSKLYLNI